MAFGLKSHLHTHQISSIPLVRNQQAPLFQVQPISFSPLQLRSRRTNPKGFNALYLEKLNGNGGSGGGGGGGGGVEDTRKERGGDGGGGSGVGDVVRLFLRFAELLLDPDRVIVGAVGLPANLALLCVQAMWELHLAFVGIATAAVLLCTCVGVVFISAVVTFLFVQFG